MSNADILFAFGELADKEPTYEMWDDYFKGEVQVIQLSARAARKFGKSEYLINFLKPVVTAVANRLEIESVAVSDSDPLSNVLNDEIWSLNQMALEAPTQIRKVCYLGDGYLMVGGNAEDGIFINYNGPKTTRVFYDPENPRIKLFAAKRWYVESPLGKSQNYWRLNLYYADRLEKYATKAGTRKTDTLDNWIEFMDEGDTLWPIPNVDTQGRPLGIPVFHLRVGDSPYGVPEHIDGIPVQNALNLHVSRQTGSVDYYTLPIMYALRDPSAGLNAVGDDAWDDEEELLDGETPAVNPIDTANRAALSGDAGALWYLQGVKSVGQFSPPKPENFLQPMTFYLRTLSLLTDTPGHLFDPSGDPPSGESRKVAEMPLNKKVKSRQDTLGAGYGAALEYAMKLLTGEDVSVDVRWASPETASSKEDMETALLKIQLGVPRKEVLMELGYSAEAANQWEQENYPDMPSATPVVSPVINGEDNAQ